MVAEDPATVLRALESLARTGWMLRGVPPGEAETVAAHLFKAAVIALDIGYRLRDEGVQLEPERAALIALLHDTGESIIGDIPKTAGISEAKKRAEQRAVDSLPFHPRVRELVHEFEEDSSEALLARLAESLATLLRAIDYERQGYPVGEIRESMKRVIASVLSRVEWGSTAARIIEEAYGVRVDS